LEASTDLGDLEALRVVVVGDVGQQRVERRDELLGDADIRAQAPAPALAQGDQAGLAGRQFDGGLEDALEHRGQLELFGDRARDLEQIVTLADAEIGQHGSILSQGGLDSQ